jgi:hypothetical protein
VIQSEWCQEEFWEFAPAVTQLLMLRRPAARAGASGPKRGCSLVEGSEESSPDPSKGTAKRMNSTENLTSTGCATIAPQPINQIFKPIKSPLNLGQRALPNISFVAHRRDNILSYWKAV